MGCAQRATPARTGSQEEVGRLHQPAAEDDELRVEEADEAGDAHRQPLDRLARPPAALSASPRRAASAASSAVDAPGAPRERRDRPPPPRKRPYGRSSSRHRGERASQPNGAGDAARAAAGRGGHRARHAGADAGADGEEDDVGAAAGRALPLLAEDVAAAVGVDHDRRQAGRRDSSSRSGAPRPCPRGSGPTRGRSPSVDARHDDADAGRPPASRRPAAGTASDAARGQRVER